MAQAEVMSTRLRLVYYVGDNPDTGLPVFKNKNFNRVKVDSTPSQLYAVAVAVAALQDDNLYGIERFDTSDIYQD